MKPTTPHGKNLRLAFFFILGVICLIVLSFIWRLTVLIAQSKFDGQHQFVVAVGDPVKKIVCFIPETKSASILTLKEKVNTQEIGKLIQLPIDAYVQGDTQESMTQIFWKSIFTFTNTDTINAVDKAKLWWSIQSLHGDTIAEKEIKIPVSEDIFADVIQKLFLDKSLYQEAKTIQVINATGLPGYGTRLARLLTNIGGNVIMVSTGKTIEDISVIHYTDEISYSHRRLKQVLQMKMSESTAEPVIADIIITIGKDKIDTKIF